MPCLSEVMGLLWSQGSDDSNLWTANVSSSIWSVRFNLAAGLRLVKGHPRTVQSYFFKSSLMLYLSSDSFDKNNAIGDAINVDGISCGRYFLPWNF